MRKSIIKNVTIENSFYIFAATILLLVPLRLALAWIFAIVIHELCHYLALKAYMVPILSVSISAAGIKMDTEFMSGKQEFICAIAGPLGGLIVIFFARWLPCTAICALIHSLFNLIPIYPLDGGRSLRCILFRMFGQHNGEKISIWIGYTILAVLLILALMLTIRFNMGILPVVLVMLIIGKIKLANRSNK